MSGEDPLSEFDFELPEARIALRPAEPRDASRLLVVRADGRFEDRWVSDLPDLVSAPDALVFNDSRVLPAALRGVRPARDPAGTDVSVDVNLVEALGSSRWKALARPGKRLRIGDEIRFAGGSLTAVISHKGDDGDLVLEFGLEGSGLTHALQAHGAMPLPPYIARRRPADESDRRHYQTVYAAGEARSVAAPTAGLHFTDRLLGSIQAAGIKQFFVRLHVGLGTFSPLSQTQIETGRLHEEWCGISEDTATQLNALRAEGGRCIAVGTTALRTLESAAAPNGTLSAWQGETDIFIRPGYRFRAVDGLMTNFHLPRSSLFMLVCALMGTDTMQAAYAHAIAEEYRFYSYGDACLLLP